MRSVPFHEQRSSSLAKFLMVLFLAPSIIAPFDGHIDTGSGHRISQSSEATPTGQCISFETPVFFGAMMLINEIYPDPSMDLNGDGAADQLDEFIELYNPGGQDIDLGGWSLTDNTNTFSLNGRWVQAFTHLELPRNITGLRLGNDDMVSLIHPNGSVVDRVAFNSVDKGWSVIRSPDGSSRIRTTTSPSPGDVNPGPPRVMITEVMVDPEGANTGKQWVELLNIGSEEDLKDYVLDNGDGIVIDLSGIVLARGNRTLVTVGPSSTIGPHPPEVPVLEGGLEKAFYVNGDDLELRDRDGFSVDYVAWGNSSHIGGPAGAGEGLDWTGKLWDDWKGKMSETGTENVKIAAGRSLMRWSEEKDTDSPQDWGVCPYKIMSTPGWNNSVDPVLSMTLPSGPVQMSEGEVKEFEVGVSGGANRTGTIEMNATSSNASWEIELNGPGSFSLSKGGQAVLHLLIRAPADLRTGHTTYIGLEAKWSDMAFVPSISEVQCFVPAVDLSFDDAYCRFDGIPSREVPQGGIVELGGILCGGGDIGCDLALILLEVRTDIEGGADITLLSMERAFNDIKPASRRTFAFDIDTLGLAGNISVHLLIDPFDTIAEVSEENNALWFSMTIIPSPPTPGQLHLKMVEILWNMTEGCMFAAVENTWDRPLDLSDVIISSGELSCRFPQGSYLNGSQKAYVAWGEEAMTRLPFGSLTFRMDGRGPRDLRMVCDGPLPDPGENGYLSLQTRFRKPLDLVVLKGHTTIAAEFLICSEGIVETTWGSVLIRFRDSQGRPIDTNSSLDWSVNRPSPMIRAFHPSPKVGGSGEFVILETRTGGSDLSGVLISCNNRFAVVPNGTLTAPDGRLVLAEDALSFFSGQGFLPDLVVGRMADLEGISIPGTNVPGNEDLVLPNNGGQLLLLDPGNRVIDLVTWGLPTNYSIGSPSPDSVLWRASGSGGGKGSWTVAGTGSFPLNGVHPYLPIEGDLTLFREVEQGLGWVLRDSSALIFSPIMLPSAITEVLCRYVEEGGALKVHLTSAPWEAGSAGGFIADPSNDPLRFAIALQRRGADILYQTELNDPTMFPPAVLCGARLLVILGPWDNGMVEKGTVSAIGLQIGNETLTDIIERSLIGNGRLAWMEAEEVITGFSRTIGPFTFKEGGLPVQEPNGYVDCGVSTTLPFIPGWAMQDSEVTILHQAGPLDICSIVDMAAAGCKVRLMLSPLGLSPRPKPSSPGANGSSGMWEGLRELDMDELNEDVQQEALWALALSGSMGWDLEVRIIPAGYCMMGPYDLTVSGSSASLWIGPFSNEAPGARISFVFSSTNPILDHLEDLWVRSMEVPHYLLGVGGEGILDDPPPTVRIEEVYYDTYLVNDPDEYIALHNFGNESVDVSGFTISDDEGGDLYSDGTMVIPDGLSINPGDMLFLARDDSAFLEQNGFLPDLAFMNWSMAGRAFVIDGDLRLSNNNDSIFLRDRNGIVVDLMVYGNDSLGGRVYWSYPSGAWSGGTVPDIPWGHVLFRERRDWSSPPIDTGAARDWLSFRPRHPGQSRLKPSMVSTASSSILGVCPDSGSSVLEGIISNASNELLVNVYELTSARITSALLGARARGVEVSVLLEGGPVGGITLDGSICIQKLIDAGIAVRTMSNSPSQDVRDRYRYDHAKYMIADSDTLFVSSDNFKDSSFPPHSDRSCSSGTRGWAVSVFSPSAASYMRSVFFEDWSGPDITDASGLIDVGSLGTIARPATPPSSSVASSCLPSFRSVEDITVQVLVSPDHLGLSDNPLIRTISDAREEVLVEVMELDVDFSLQSMPADCIPAGSSLWKIPGSGCLNPYLGAMFTAASKGAFVKILLDGSDHNGDGTPDNERTVIEIEEMASYLGLNGMMEVQLHPSPRRDLDRELTNIHNKGIIIDGRNSWVSSFNLNPTSAMENREVGILIGSPRLSEHLRKAFLFDWGGTLFNDLSLRSGRYLMGADGRGGFESSAFSIEVDWRANETLSLWICPAERSCEPLWGKQNSSPLELPGHFKGRIEVPMPIYGIEQDVLSFYLMAASGNRSCTMLLIDAARRVGTDRYLNEAPWWGGPYIPILIISLSSLGIAAIVSMMEARGRKAKKSAFGGEE